MKNQYLFITIGAPGCGKTRFYHQIAEDGDWSMGDTPAYVSSDEVRILLLGSAEFQENPEMIFKVVRSTIETELDKGMSVYFDATNTRKDWRRFAIDIAMAREIPVVALYFDVPFFILWRRNKKRHRTVPFNRMVWHFFHQELPTTTEGFDTIFRIDRNGQYIEME